MMRKRVSVKLENGNGRNVIFHDNKTGKDMSRAQFVTQIKNGNYSDYHVRKINGINTPASNPDRSKNNNLG
ncbi:MAG: hypothetical protein IK954_02500 [Clostridia bacterium]|nr:hypothetical protein [Clostridia bacterium]